MNPIVALIDFDGTLTRQDTSHVILNHYTGDRWIPINDAWRRFEVTTEQRAQSQFTMVHTTPAELAALVVDQVQIDPHFLAFHARAQTRAWKIHVLSDGYDFYIRRILAANGLSQLEFTANHLNFVDGRIRLTHQHQHPNCRMCGNCKLSVALAYRRAGYRLVVIGDGYSDRGGAQIADRVYAKGHLARFCAEREIPFNSFESFADVMVDLETRSWQIQAGGRALIDICPRDGGGNGA